MTLNFIGRAQNLAPRQLLSAGRPAARGDNGTETSAALRRADHTREDGRASTRGWLLGTRRPYMSAVVPRSPVRVAMDTVAAISFLVQGRWLHAQAVIGAFLSFFLALVTFIKKRLELELLLDRIRISPQPNRQGILPKSIVFQYFILQKKYFDQL